MKTFFNVEDLGDLKAALAEAQEVKANRFGYQELGKNKTLLMIFFNNSLRTLLYPKHKSKSGCSQLLPNIRQPLCLSPSSLR